SKTTLGRIGEVKARWVIRIPTMSSVGSALQEVPYPPFPPNWPGVAARSSRFVTTVIPKPHPRVSQQRPGHGDAAFCLGVGWSVVIVSTEGLDRMRSRPCFPLVSNIRQKAR